MNEDNLENKMAPMLDEAVGLLKDFVRQMENEHVSEFTDHIVEATKSFLKKQQTMKMDKEFFKSLDLTPQPDRPHEILTAYSKYLEHNMYLDSDWWCEHPNTVDAFLKKHPQEKS